MTVTQRRVRNDPDKPDERGATEPGIKYTCDVCHLDITHTVRIKCAAKECEEVDICPSCFCEGREFQRHKAWHDYKVVEQHSQPIFTEDWGADEELLLISGLVINGLRNWIEVAQHVGTRTKEECERHYYEVYLRADVADKEKMLVDMRMEIDVGNEVENRKREFMPDMDKSFSINPDEFQVRKKARIEEMRKPQALPTGQPAPLVSAPTNHEIGGFMPGRLEFEHEIYENEAEQVVKDFEFGLVWKYGGDEQPEALVTKAPGDEDEGVEAAPMEVEVKKEIEEVEVVKIKEEPMDDGNRRDQPEASTSRKTLNGVSVSPEKVDNGKGKGRAVPGELEEHEDELEVKLALLGIYFSKLDKREESKDLIFDRGLTEYKKIQMIDRRRPKDEKELINRYKVFAKLQTAQDFEVLTEGLIYEQSLRKRISELQEYRRMGVTTAAEAESYETVKTARAGYRAMPPRERLDIVPGGARINAGQNRHLQGMYGGTPPPGSDPRRLVDSREPTPRMLARKPAIPLNLANSAALDLLSTEEQSLCAMLRVLPKPYLVIKEMYLRENERRQGLLRRRDARRMLKIDVNKSGKIFDFLVSSGMLSLTYDPAAKGLGPGKEGMMNVGGEVIRRSPVAEVYTMSSGRDGS